MKESLRVNTTISHYRILSRIGAGGMGEVYLAEDTQLGRRVAIKLLPPETVSDEHARKRLIREARAAAKLDHPNICSVYEVGEEGGRSFIAMQYIEGETLDARIKSKPLALKESLTIAAQIADALAEAHSHGIIHRDIKPGNIMITSRGQAKVMDFGLARVIAGSVETEAETQSLLTTPGTIMGTMPYMSPEQVRGEVLDGRSDIFSFGVVLYEMLSGRQPFASESAAATISAILNEEPPPLLRYAPDLPEELQRITRKCLEKDRERRCQTMRDVAIDLDNCRREHETAQATASQRDQGAGGEAVIVPASDLKRHKFLSSRRALMAGALLGLLVGVVLAYVLVFRRGARTERPPEIKSLAVLPLKSLDAGENVYAWKALFLETTEPVWAERAKEEINRAQTLDPQLAETHIARYLLLWSAYEGFQSEAAVRELLLAQQLNPNIGHDELASLYQHIGLEDLAARELQRAFDIDPTSEYVKAQTLNLYFLVGKYDEWLAAHHKLYPNDPISAWYFLGKGRLEDAQKAIEEMSAKEPNNPSLPVRRAMLLALKGDFHSAEAAIPSILSKHPLKDPTYHHVAYDIACIYALEGKSDKAVKWLREAAATGFPCYPLFERDAYLNRIRQVPEFIQFMAEMKAQNERYRREFGEGATR